MVTQPTPQWVCYAHSSAAFPLLYGAQMIEKGFKSKMASEPTKAAKFHHRIAEKIMSGHTLIYCVQNFYEYSEGLYIQKYDPEIHQWMMAIIKEKYTRHVANEIISILKNKCFIRPERINYTDLINLKNGMLDLSNSEPKLLKHDSKYLSTIQLDINYVEEACPFLWDKTLKEILHWEDVKTIQEFFGLCLTKNTTFQKALFMVGEGSNGKGVITHVLERLVGLNNRSCIPIEKLSDEKLIGGLYEKLINISTETTAKGFIHDSTFKTVVAGESIHANPKYKIPFEFTPFCKMIITTNNMPKTNDTSYAFFRRMIIIPFERQFSEEEQNKQLRYELEEELSGILLWAVSGLMRLRKNKCFTVSDRNKKQQKEYQKSNNPVLLFVEECCYIEINAFVGINLLYEKYSNFCKNSNYRALGKNNFSKEVKRQFKELVNNDNKKLGNRVWEGIGYNE